MDEVSSVAMCRSGLSDGRLALKWLYRKRDGVTVCSHSESLVMVMYQMQRYTADRLYVQTWTLKASIRSLFLDCQADDKRLCLVVI